jgi:hypothetical protein
MPEEPTAGNLHGGVCGGRAGQLARLPGKRRLYRGGSKKKLLLIV